VKKSKGYRRSTRRLSTKAPRDKGKPKLGKLLIAYEVGSQVIVKIDSSVQKSLPHKRFHGKIGVVQAKRGRIRAVVENMDTRELSEKKLALPQVKKELLALGEENLDQFQRRTFDYVSKFSKVDEAAVEGLLERLVKEFGLNEDEAVQVVNCAPESVDELRVFLAGGKKIIETAKLEAIIALLNASRVAKE
jgi:ribosomal protein L21E